MKRVWLLLLIFSFRYGYSQDKIYRSSYNINILKEDEKGNFGFGVETSHGVRIWRYFILSGVLGYNRYTHLDKNLMYLAAELK